MTGFAKHSLNRSKPRWRKWNASPLCANAGARRRARKPADSRAILSARFSFTIRAATSIPQLHGHAVLANATWDAARNEWLALQPVEMLRASPYLRQVLYRELAGRLRALGYEPYEMNSKGFSVRGVEHLRERFSKHARQVQNLAEEYAAKKGRKPTKREVEILVRESREDKLTEISTPEVHARQRAELSRDESRALDDLVRTATMQAPRIQSSRGNTQTVLEAALRHVYERNSVVREGDVLRAALELHPDFYRWRELRQALDVHPDVIRKEGEMRLRPIRREEDAAVQRVIEGRNQRFALGDPAHLPASLTPGQKIAARAILENRDFMSVLVGDAGTGKTTVLTAIEGAHLAAGGQRFMPLAPTTRARDAMMESGFAGADTVQRFLVSETMQVAAFGGRVCPSPSPPLCGRRRCKNIFRGHLGPRRPRASTSPHLPCRGERRRTKRGRKRRTTRRKWRDHFDSYSRSSF